MKKFLLTAGAALLLFIVGRALVNAIVSEETHVRWLVEDIVEGFNDTRANPCITPLAREFVDEPSGADRELVHAGLVRLFFTAKDPTTKRFEFVAELPEEGWRVEVRDGSPKTATLECVVHFRRRRGEALEPAWDIRVNAELEKREEGWRIVRTKHETTGGERLR